MVKRRVVSTYGANRGASPAIDSLLLRLRTGLTSISGLFENYAIAFEALGGMRGREFDGTATKITDM